MAASSNTHTCKEASNENERADQRVHVHIYIIVCVEADLESSLQFFCSFKQTVFLLLNGVHGHDGLL